MAPATLPDLTTVDIVLFDCDGVLWRGKTAIDGASRVVKSLQKMGKHVYFISNNSSADRAQYVIKLAAFGIVADLAHVVCSSYATAAYLTASGHRGKVYAIGQEGIGHELRHAGIDCIEARLLHRENVGRDQLETVSVDEAVTAVVVGFDHEFNYLKMAYAGWLLYKRPEVRFVSTNSDPMYPAGTRYWPGAGACVAAVATVAQRDPFNIGKPEPYMFQLIQRRDNLDPKRCIMIGDNLGTDIVFGARCGMRTVLVLSGVTTRDDLEHSLPDAAHPDYVIDSVANLIPES